MGVWIETVNFFYINPGLYVTPFVGVWIETGVEPMLPAILPVTPFVGVWIETETTHWQKCWKKSHPSWVCGLKLGQVSSVTHVPLSHPSWVCGLKLSQQIIDES